MKHITLILTGTLLFAISASGQIKKQTKSQKDNHSTTLVIKESNEVDDMELLNESFDIDDYDVGDVIIIATDEGNDSQSLSNPQSLASDVPLKLTKAKKKIKVDKKVGKGSVTKAYKKKRKKPSKKVEVAFQGQSKRSKRAKWDRKCYSW